MGYTHYFSKTEGALMAPKGWKPRRWALALKRCQQLIYNYAQENGGISGYNAHTKPGKYSGLKVNGSRGEECEDFIVPGQWDDLPEFNFCKTNRRLYDDVVGACLILLKHYMPNSVDVSHDGDNYEYYAGIAKQYTGLKHLTFNGHKL